MAPGMLAQVPAGITPSMALPTPAPEVSLLDGSPYELLATFACVMLLTTLVVVVFSRPGALTRIIAAVPFSLFILCLIALPLDKFLGWQLIDFSLDSAAGFGTSTLRLAAELACYLAAWQSTPWLYVGKDASINFAVRLLTRR